MDTTKLKGHFKTSIAGLCSLALIPAGLMIASAADTFVSPPGGAGTNAIKYGIPGGGVWQDFLLDDQENYQYAKTLNKTEFTVGEPQIFLAGENGTDLKDLTLAGVCAEPVETLSQPSYNDQDLCKANKMIYIDGEYGDGVNPDLQLLDNNPDSLEILRLGDVKDYDARQGALFVPFMNSYGTKPFLVLEYDYGNGYYGRFRLPSRWAYDFSKLTNPQLRADYVLHKQDDGTVSALSYAEYRQVLAADAAADSADDTNVDNQDNSLPEEGKDAEQPIINDGDSSTGSTITNSDEPGDDSETGAEGSLNRGDLDESGTVNPGSGDSSGDSDTSVADDQGTTNGEPGTTSSNSSDDLVEVPGVSNNPSSNDQGATGSQTGPVSSVVITVEPQIQPDYTNNSATSNSATGQGDETVVSTGIGNGTAGTTRTYRIVAPSVQLRGNSNPPVSSSGSAAAGSSSSSSLNIGGGTSDTESSTGGQEASPSVDSDATLGTGSITSQDQGTQTAPRAPQVSSTTQYGSAIDRIGGMGTVVAIVILALVGASGAITLARSLILQRRENQRAHTE